MIISLDGVAPEAVVERHLSHLVSDRISASPDIRGGQMAANAALNAFDVTGYAAKRNQVLPQSARGASRLSPYIRHGLLPLREVWKAAVGPSADVSKFRDELLWQEYSRHLYARVGMSLHDNLRFEVPWSGDFTPEAWPREMACVNWAISSLETDGWLVNQTRMWLASQYTVRSGAGWVAGQEYFHQHLLDGSRAANLLGWQWTVGAGSGKPYGFARWQVEKRAPKLCMACPLNCKCPIQNFPEDSDPRPVAEPDPRLMRDDDLARTRGPATVVDRSTPRSVVLTVESLGDDDPALVAHPQLPVIFVFDEPALQKLKLSSKRLVFFVETLQDLAERREVIVHLGDPRKITPGLDAAITWAPVPSFAKYATTAAQMHPWPWLAEPHAGSVKSFSAWRQKLTQPKSS
ncbi:FAD-binding domain-containing protein [Frigoribacterium sp. CG_9.8]|uniref:FAD-binding domain-containing protein n=1 Tax=Frigoribacterium sp. CG_9.8 TaxID=2787733 RepID=UPI0018C8D787|nr:FAD-binding domain-containing protein [Frigoribacterium sp. CG_9.8]MBG6107359.1 deoxyribodipyrimidine photo-lyase [Frigoribacterium sp. CG_9.8]